MATQTVNNFLEDITVYKPKIYNDDSYIVKSNFFEDITVYKPKISVEPGDIIIKNASEPSKNLTGCNGCNGNNKIINDIAIDSVPVLSVPPCKRSMCLIILLLLFISCYLICN
jgi:hypothetical protein